MSNLKKVETESEFHEYINAKDITKRRLYLETMLEVLPNIENIYIVDEEQQSVIPLLQLAKKEVASK